MTRRACIHHHTGRAFSSFVFCFWFVLLSEARKEEQRRERPSGLAFLLLTEGFNGREVGWGMLDFCLFWTGQDGSITYAVRGVHTNSLVMRTKNRDKNRSGVN